MAVILSTYLLDVDVMIVFIIPEYLLLVILFLYIDYYYSAHLKYIKYDVIQIKTYIVYTPL